MEILINNNSVTTSARNLMLLSEELELPRNGVAIAIGNTMIPRTEWEATPLTEGDSITIIKAACGG